MAHGVSFISGFGLGCQTRRVGLWGGGLEFRISDVFGNFGSMFLGIFWKPCFLNWGRELILIPTGRPALDSDVLGGGSQWKSYGLPTDVGALMSSYCIRPQRVR
jgi:hypothetical protein